MGFAVGSSTPAGKLRDMNESNDDYPGITDEQLALAVRHNIKDDRNPTEIAAAVIPLSEAIKQLLTLLERTNAKHAELEHRLEQLDL